jgi:bifunctional non-homologous end joining protein LigD
LKYAGKVGTGYDDATLRQMSKQLRSLTTGKIPWRTPRGVHWVVPKLVAQIGFSEWAADGKLRHPRFLGLRDDKDAREVVREK